MAKVLAPLLSLQAKGRFANTIAFQKFGHGGVARRARKFYIPTDPRSPIQLFNRDYFAVVIQIWHNLSDEEKDIFVALSQKLSLTGFNLYIQEYRAQHPTDLGNFRLGFSDLGYMVV